MSNNISDITVNITVEDVVNPAAFGGMCLFDLADDKKGIVIPYTEVYSMDEAVAVINASDMKEVSKSVTFNTLGGENATKAELDALSNSKIMFSGSSYTVESNNKAINGVSYSKRIKGITEDNGFIVSLDEGEIIGIVCIGSSKGKTTTLTIKDNSAGNIVFSKDIDTENGEYVSFTSKNGATSYTVYSTSTNGTSMHIYAIEIFGESTKAIAMKTAAQLAFMQEPKPEKIGLLSCAYDDLSKYMNGDWRYLIPIVPGSINLSDFKKLAGYIEADGDARKVLACYFSTEEYPALLEYLKALKDYERTFVYIGVEAIEDNTTGVDLNQIPTALIAKTSNKPVGSFTYKNQALKGVYADEGITKAQLEEYHSNNVNAYVHKAGYDVTSEGKLLNGEYIDILDAKDWLITQIKYQLQQCLIINDKIPYDNNGIALLESIVYNILQDAYNNGLIAVDDGGNPDFTVDFKPRSETKSSDREQRHYVEGNFSFALAGAIHEVTINGTINI